MTVPRPIRRAGLVPAAAFAVLSLWSLRIGFRIWQNPSQFVVVGAESAFILHSAIIIAVLLVFSLCLGSGLKIYQWSMATPNETDPAEGD